MNKKIPLFFLIIITVLLTSCSDLLKKNKSIQKDVIDNSPPSIKSLETTNITVSFSTNLDDPRGQALSLFKELVETQTENRIKIQIFPNGKIDSEEKALSDTELIQSLISNKLDMTVSSAGNYASFIPKAGLSALPYLFNNFKDAWIYVDGEIISNINTEFADCNMIVLSQFDNGFRCITTSKAFGAINTLSDLKGLNIRTPQNQIVMETMIALGAAPRCSSFTTLKADILDGKFDAQENPIPVIYNSKIYEVQKYLAITNHSYDAMPLTIRKNLWDSLKPLDRLIIKDAALQAQEFNRNLIKQQTEDYIKLLKAEGMIITYPDLNDFSQATKNVADVFAPIYGDDLLAKIKK